MQNEAIPHLVGYSLSPLAAVLGVIDDEAKEAVNTALESFLYKKISKQEAGVVIFKHLGSTQPLDKLDEIIQVGEVPISFIIDQTALSKFSAGRNRTRAWTNNEDLRLLSGMWLYGIRNWSAVATHVGNSRTKAQCSQRWFRGLDPRIEKTPWSSDQDAELLKCVEIFGDKAWTRIAEEIKNRSDVQCRYRYLQLSKGNKSTAYANEYPDDSSIEISFDKKMKLKKKSIDSSYRIQPQNLPITTGNSQNLNYQRIMQIPDHGQFYAPNSINFNSVMVHPQLSMMSAVQPVYNAGVSTLVPVHSGISIPSQTGQIGPVPMTIPLTSMVHNTNSTQLFRSQVHTGTPPSKMGLTRNSTISLHIQLTEPTSQFSNVSTSSTGFTSVSLIPSPENKAALAEKGSDDAYNSANTNSQWSLQSSLFEHSSTNLW